MYFLKAKLRRLGRKAGPTRAFQDELFLRLVPKPVVSYRQHAFRFAAVGMASLLVVFGTGTSVYAYDSPDVSDGHPLYPIKQGIERIEERFAANSEQRAEFHARMMGRRMAEAERLDGAKEQITRILESAAAELDLSVDELKGDLRDPEKRKELLDQLSETNERYAEVLSRVPKGKHRPLPPPEKMRMRVQQMRHAVGRDPAIGGDERPPKSTNRLIPNP